MICFSISAPFPWGTEGGVDTAPKASGCILGGTRKGSQGGTGKAEAAKTAGRGNYPEAVPKERSGGNGAVNTNSRQPETSGQIDGGQLQKEKLKSRYFSEMREETLQEFGKVVSPNIVGPGG